MEVSDGCSASNGQCSPIKEKSRMLADMSMHNGETVFQGPNSPSDLSIKQEEEMVEEAERRRSPPEGIGRTGERESAGEAMAVSPSDKRDGLPGKNATDETASRQPHGDRPFQCKQCGVSFTQKGNLLRHIKLHTGEKPFKCPFCSYACRRRDALTGHLRTHAVGKPHKCNFCGRSYKQRASLEEHKERCHGYLQSIGLDPTPAAGPYAGDVPKEPRPMAAFERPVIIERLNVGKRKSTTPQKFVGERMGRYNFPDLGYEVGLKFDKHAELLPAQMMEQSLGNTITYMGAESFRPFLQHPKHPLSMADMVPMVNPLFQHLLPIGQRAECSASRDTAPSQQPPPPDFQGHPAANGPVAFARRGVRALSRQEASPSNSGLDSADSARSSPQERQGYHGGNPSSGLRPCGSPATGYSGNHLTEASPKNGSEMVPGVLRAALERPASHDAVRVFGREGQEVPSFQCEHCQVLFLDHVMYTIHMGCHGYRDPLECNICGHCSKDRYEFSSHIARGEHTVQ